MWASVCGNTFNKDEAVVVCRQLGYNSTEGTSDYYASSLVKSYLESILVLMYYTFAGHEFCIGDYTFRFKVVHLQYCSYGFSSIIGSH